MAEHLFDARTNQCARCHRLADFDGIVAELPCNPPSKPLDSTEMLERLLFVESELMRRDERIKLLEARLAEIVRVAHGRK